MASMAELQRAVDEAFDRRAAHLPRWPDPHPDRMPYEEEYSRVTHPERWRIVPARAEAWCEAAVTLGVGSLEHDVAVRWATDVRMPFERVDRLVPRRPDAIPLVLAYSAFEQGEGPSGVTLGIGDPAVVVDRAPACGCDACDSGSDAELGDLDDQIRRILSGEVRHLSRGERTIVAFGSGWSVSGSFRRRQVERVLADPAGWTEVSGAAWLDR